MIEVLRENNCSQFNERDPNSLNRWSSNANFPLPHWEICLETRCVCCVAAFCETYLIGLILFLWYPRSTVTALTLLLPQHLPTSVFSLHPPMRSTQVTRCMPTAPCREAAASAPLTSRTAMAAAPKTQQNRRDWPRACPFLCPPPLFSLTRPTLFPPSRAASSQVGSLEMIIQTKAWSGCAVCNWEWQGGVRQGLAAKITACFHGFALISGDRLCVQLFHTCDRKSKCIQTVPLGLKSMLTDCQSK